MSIEAVSAVLHMEVKDSTAKLVLIGLANYCDSEGECYPSQVTLGRCASCCRQTVNRKIRWLETNGFIEKRAHWKESGGQTSNRYKVLLPPVANYDTPCRPSATPPVATVRHEPSLEPSVNTLSRAAELDALEIDEDLRAWFQEKAPDVDPNVLLEELVLYCESTGTTYKDYRATLKRWALREKDKPNDKRSKAGKPSPHETAHAGFARAAVSR